MKPVQILYAVLWIAAGTYTWVSGPWSDSAAPDSEIAGTHDSMFHMHQPLHEGGKVTMVGQLHLELASQSDGTHRLWISDVVRKEFEASEFNGTLRIEHEDGEAIEVSLSPNSESDGDTKGLVARTEPLSGQVNLSVTGNLGRMASFDGVRFFWDYDPDFDLKTPLGLDSMIPVPSGNQLTDAKVELGRELFHDARLSVDGSVSCASCHRPDYAFAEPKAVTEGVAGRSGRRNTPTVLNSVYLTSLFWDGRAASLEEQAIAPIIAHAEMGVTDVASLVQKLKLAYGDRMRVAFSRPLSLHTIGMAIASYERTLLSGDSDFDRFEAGDRDAISVAAHRGRALFFGKAQCGNCHVPPLFTDLAFHNLGVGWSESGAADTGRFEATGNPEDRGTFKTPSLRDAARTAPYMHDGSLPTLRSVVEFYNQGCRPNPGVSKKVGPLNLNDRQLDDLVEFLGTLNGRFDNNVVVSQIDTAPDGLPARVPQLFSQQPDFASPFNATSLRGQNWMTQRNHTLAVALPARQPFTGK